VGRYPGNKRFAFTIFDDTDYSTFENTAPVYRFLAQIGMRTTKSVWPLGPVEGARVSGATLQDRQYLGFVRWLKDEGFEVALHNVQNHDATRDVIQRGLQEFERLLQRSVRVHCNHSNNRDNLYWGVERIESRGLRLGYNLATRFAHRGFFMGHIPASPYFWGDICKEKIDYVRNFVFDEINLDRVNPTMPYQDPGKPFVNYWFSSSEGDTVESFCSMLREENQDRLEAEEGVCIMYTHFGKRFCNDVLHPEFERLMLRLSKMSGWFVPVSELLDHLKSTRASSLIPPTELKRMELRWLVSKLRRGSS
jgi:hypothetical protein